MYIFVAAVKRSHVFIVVVAVVVVGAVGVIYMCSFVASAQYIL